MPVLNQLQFLCGLSTGSIDGFCDQSTGKKGKWWFKLQVSSFSTSIIKLFFYFFISCKGFNVFAATENKSLSNSNIRIGFGVAGEYVAIDANLKIRALGNLSTISSTQQQTCKRFQIAPSLEIGTTIMGDYYVGFIVSWRYTRASTTSLSPIYGTKFFSHEFRLNSYANAFVKLGYKPIPQVMFYGLVGPSIAKWSHTTQQIALNSTTKASILQNEFNMKEKTVGLGVGGGIEYLIKKKYALGFEYVFHTHRSRSATGAMSYIGIGNSNRTGALTKIVQPSYSTFAIRLSYFFSL